MKEEAATQQQNFGHSISHKQVLQDNEHGPRCKPLCIKILMKVSLFMQ